MNRCRYCDAPIRWVRTENDRRMPLNPDPDPHGNVVIRDGRAVVLTAAPTVTTGLRYMPHHATCERAQQARAGRRRRS